MTPVQQKLLDDMYELIKEFRSFIHKTQEPDKNKRRTKVIITSIKTLETNNPFLAFLQPFPAVVLSNGYKDIELILDEGELHEMRFKCKLIGAGGAGGGTSFTEVSFMWDGHGMVARYKEVVK